MIYFNGQGFDIEVEEISRNYKKTKAYDVVTQDTLRHVKYNSVKLDMYLQFVIMEQDIYRQLLSIFNTTQPTVTVKIEDNVNGDIEFTAINPEVEDECEFYDDNKVYWGSMKIRLEER